MTISGGSSSPNSGSRYGNTPNTSRGGTITSSSSASGGASGGSFGGGSSNGTPFQRSQTRSNSSVNRSVSVQEDGQNITVAEDNSGITVTIAANIDGVEKKRVVKAANPRQLEAKDSEAFRLYQKHLGANGPKANARATARAGGRAGGRAFGQAGGGGNGSGEQASGRSVSFSENGLSVTITEDKDGITVTTSEQVDGQEKKNIVKAANAQELERANADAFRLYQQHLVNGAANGAGIGVDATGLGGAPVDAQQLLRQELLKQIDDNANNPQIQELLRRSLESLDKR